MTREELAAQAVEYKHADCNCCQAVVKALTADMDVDAEALYNIGAAFGRGMGCMEGTCGALVGANIVAGLMGKDKAAKDILKRFKELSGATICGDLKGKGWKKSRCSCDDCVRNAITAATEILYI
ncbi:MAG: C-GCAxxG-C-C family protein [Bacillota bacterium]|nr:C-GCAxxG-C-C family protein [Bacillota bacterium]